MDDQNSQSQAMGNFSHIYKVAWTRDLVQGVVFLIVFAIL